MNHEIKSKKTKTNRRWKNTHIDTYTKERFIMLQRLKSILRNKQIIKWRKTHTKLKQTFCNTKKSNNQKNNREKYKSNRSSKQWNYGPCI